MAEPKYSTLSIFQPVPSTPILPIYLFEIHPNTTLSFSVRSSRWTCFKRPFDRSSVIVTYFRHPRQRNSVRSRNIRERICSPGRQTGRLSGALSTELNAHARSVYSWHHLPILNLHWLPVSQSTFSSVTVTLLTEYQLLILSHINNVYVLLGSRLPNLPTGSEVAWCNHRWRINYEHSLYVMSSTPTLVYQFQTFLCSLFQNCYSILPPDVATFHNYTRSI